MNSAFQKRGRVLWVCLRLAPRQGVTAADVAVACPDMDRATIYRALDDLVESRFLVREGGTLYLNEEIAVAGKRYYDALVAQSRDIAERLSRFEVGKAAKQPVAR